MQENNNENANGLTTEQTAVKEFEALMAELSEQERKKVGKLSRKDLLAYIASNRIHLTHAYGILMGASDVIAAMYEQNLLMIDALKMLVDQKSFKKLTVNSNNYSGVIEQIKKMSAKNVC